MLAFFDSLGMPEMILLVIVGLVLYGRNLPEAARNFGQVLAKFRRGFHEFKDQLDRDGQLREMKKVIDDAKRDVTSATAVPRAIADPGRALRDLTNDTLVSPINEPTTTTPPPPQQPPAD
ncbi:MAG: twin-arginine translocase TatA/TatE family subunit [Planctomycetes bacterium]|nr:twin-arginine translocase TatA/TatE family subunit [Planctomycetota bacterium]